MAENDSPTGEPERIDPRVARTRRDVLSATLRILVEDDASAATHGNLARLTGYSKATIYKHWPTRQDLIRDALSQVAKAEHHVTTGDLRADLISEITVFRREMQDHQLDRTLVALVHMLETMPDLTTVRDDLVVNGERVLRSLLAPHLQDADLEAAILMLFGLVLQSTLLRGVSPHDDEIAAAVDIVLHAFALHAPPARS